MPDHRELFDLAALDPDPSFTAALERRLAEAEGDGAFGRGASERPPDRPDRRGRRWIPVVVLAAAAAIALVAVLLTTGDRSRVTTVPATNPVPSTVGPAPSVTLPPSAPATSTGTPATSPQTAAPPATTATTAPTTQAPLPEGFAPASVTFTSPTKAWVLGDTCGRSACPAATVAATDDRGETWHVAGELPVPLGEADAGTVHSLRFANEHDGYAFGGDLWATHDGGATWREVSLPQAGDASQVVALETADGSTYAVYTSDDGFRVAANRIGTDEWTIDPLVVPYGAGPVPTAQLVLDHGAGWLVENDRVVTAGARLVAGTWSAWTPPCLDAGGPVLLAASDAQHLVAVCAEGVWGGPPTPATKLYRSADGGGSFEAAPTEVPIPAGSVTGVTSPQPGTVVVAGADASGAPTLVATFDDGQTWTVVWSGAGAASWCDLGFTTTEQGVVIVGHDDRSSDLLMTRDGGHTWEPMTFGR